MKTMMIAVMLCALVSCRVAIPTPAKLSDAKIGPAPSRECAVAAAKDLLPEGDIVFGDIKPGFYATDAGAQHQRFAWQMIARGVTAGGVEPHHFYFLGDQLVATAFPNAAWNGREYPSIYRITQMNGGGLPAYRAGFSVGGHRWVSGTSDRAP